MILGVTGHRAARLRGSSARIRRTARAYLATLAEPPRLHTQLAEGADRILAEEVLRAGGAIVVVLPFVQREYERDFSAASRRAFRALLARADAVVTLRGSRANAEAAYEAAGRRVLAAIETLVAVWDGEPERGRGGTAQIVREALRRELPVFWIPAG